MAVIDAISGSKARFSPPPTPSEGERRETSGRYEAALEKVPLRITNPELIPARRYYDAAFFEAEKELLWPHVWQMACRLEEIPNIGDWVEYKILDKSVIVVSTKHGVKAFHNACRHRGQQLATGHGNCGVQGFICPFHGWRWNAEGENTFVFGRKIFNEELLAKAEIDLATVRIDFWAGCAFINFDDDAPSLRDSLGPVAERLDARNVDRLKMDWWCGTILPTNWKTAMEAFMEGYHVMKTHGQLHAVTPYATVQYGADATVMEKSSLTSREVADLSIKFARCISEGMGGGIIHPSEIAVLEKLEDIEVPNDPLATFQSFFEKGRKAIVADGQAKGVPIFDLQKVEDEYGTHAVEFMFPHFFLLPMFGTMASYRVRPLTPETCLFEIWCLGLRPEGQPFDTPKEPTMLPYDSADFPEIPRQDYSNLPLQQLGLHAGKLEYLRLSREVEGLISNYQRLIDGYLADLPQDKLVEAAHIVNQGFDAPIRDIGF